MSRRYHSSRVNSRSAALVGFADAVGIGGADDGQDFGRMLQQPRERHHRAADAARPGNGVHGRQEPLRLIGFLGRQQARCAAANQSGRQRAPGHRGDSLNQALIQRAVGERVQLGQADFHLVRHQRHRTGRLQRGHQGRTKVADAEVADFAGGLELRKRLGDLLGISQEIRPVQQVKVNRLDAQPSERLLAGVDDMRRREVVARRASRVAGRLAGRMPPLVTITTRSRMPETSLSASPRMRSASPRQ